MIKVSVFYPASDNAKFDIDYYCNSHMPMVKEKLSPAIKSIAVEHGVGGATPGAPPTFVAMGHLYFESAESFEKAFGPHASQIMADIPNYTNVQPTIQISEVKL